MLRIATATVFAAALLIAGAAAPVHADLGALKSAVTYYQSCSSLKPAYPGEAVHPNPKLQPGKIGTGFLFERRLWGNPIADPDFTGAVPDAWLAIGKPAWQAGGGFADPHCCAVTATDYVRQVVLDIKEQTLYCFSIYAKSAAGGSLVLAVKSVGTSRQFQSPPLTGDFARFKLVFTSDAAVATFTVKSASATPVVVDAAQLEPGKSWPAQFWPKASWGGTEWVDLPAGPEFINPMHGTVAFWLKPEWFGEESTGGMGLFSSAKEFTGWSSQKNAIILGAYRHPGQSGWENGCTFTLIDRDGQKHGYTPVEWNDRFKPGDWVHLVFTWDIQPGGDSYSACYLNGKKAGEMKFKSAAVEPMTKAYMGYSGGSYADAVMDEFYLFNRPLTVAEAAELYGLTNGLK